MEHGKHCDVVAVVKNAKTVVSKRWHPSFKQNKSLFSGKIETYFKIERIMLNLLAI